MSLFSVFIMACDSEVGLAAQVIIVKGSSIFRPFSIHISDPNVTVSEFSLSVLSGTNDCGDGFVYRVSEKEKLSFQVRLKLQSEHFSSLFR